MKITKYRPINKGSITGTFDLEIEKWGMIVHGLILFQKDGKRWITFPSKQYDKDGEKKYLPYLSFINKDHREPFFTKVSETLEAYFAEYERNNAQKN